MFAQGWVNIAPAGMSGIERFKALDFQDGSYEITVWNAHKGFITHNTSAWDTIQAYWSVWCGIDEYEEYFLMDYAKASQKSNLVISYYMQTGCIVEARGYVYRDTTGTIARTSLRKEFDDISGAGLRASVTPSAADSDNFYVAYFDAVYLSAG